MVYIVLLMFISGICGIYFCIRDIRNSTMSRAWPTAEGKVIYCNIRDSNLLDGGPVTKYLDIVYRFEVNGISYQGSDIWHGSDHTEMSEGYAESYAEIYPVDTKVKVYYDPDSPRVTVLEPGELKPQTFFLLAGSVLFVLFSIFCFYIES